MTSTTPETSATSTTRVAPSDVTIRPLRTQADFRACVALQRATWGAAFDEVVAPAILNVVQRVGGVAAGAFDARGELAGFVFGITGVEDGRVVHWSDMLAVRADLRDAGLGRRLKAWQRDAARAAGASVMYWTYDPLVARNAHLNVNVLGARAHAYVPDMYGEGTSDLHRGLGTDRLIVAWPLDRPPARSLTPSGDAADVPADLRAAPHALDAAATNAPAVRIDVPLDVHAILAADPAAAARWRTETRAAFEACLAGGRQLVGFWREPAAGVGHYLLGREGAR